MDADALATYEKYCDELTRFGSVLVGPHDAPDLARSVLMRVLTSNGWASVVELRPYLFRAMLNAASSQRRATARRLGREVEAARMKGEAMSGFVRVEVLDAIRRLTERQHAVLYLTYWLDHDVASTAADLGLPRRTVERELTSARRTLEVLLR